MYVDMYIHVCGIMYSDIVMLLTSHWCKSSWLLYITGQFVLGKLQSTARMHASQDVAYTSGYLVRV